MVNDLLFLRYLAEVHGLHFYPLVLVISYLFFFFFFSGRWTIPPPSVFHHFDDPHTLFHLYLISCRSRCNCIHESFFFFTNWIPNLSSPLSTPIANLRKRRALSASLTDTRNSRNTLVRNGRSDVLPSVSGRRSVSIHRRGTGCAQSHKHPLTRLVLQIPHRPVAQWSVGTAK